MTDVCPYCHQQRCGCDDPKSFEGTGSLSVARSSKDVVGRLAPRRYQSGDPLPALGSKCLVSGVHCDVGSDQHRSYSWRKIIGYTDDNEFVCLQTDSCWPTVERLTNCWFAEIPTPRPAPETVGTPAAVLQWAVDSFGSIALNRDERAARMAEEAIEVAQVEGVPLEVMQRITARVYSRPVGELGQEVGGLVLGLYALAANAGVDIDAEFKREFDRVLSKPRDWWTRKHAEKVAAGTADLSPRPELKAAAPQMAMLPNDHHPGPRCSCRDCQRRYPENGGSCAP